MSHAKYGADHRKRSERIRKNAVGQLCRRCGTPILPGQQVDAGHPEDRPRSVDPTSKADAPEHALKADCPEGGNRSAGAKLGNRRAKFKPSRPY